MCSVLFVFSGYVVRHRCRVPGCDTEEDTEYSQPWLNWTTPATEEGVRRRCCVAQTADVISNTSPGLGGVRGVPAG